METCKVCPRPVLPAEDLCEACMERMDHVVAQGHAQYFLDAAEQCRMHPYAAADVLKVYLTRTCNYWMDLVHFTAHVLYAENTRAVVEIVQRYHDRKRYLRAVDALLTSGGDSECRLSKSWHGVLSSPVHARIQANRSAVKEGETGERPRRVKSLTTLCYLQLPSADLAWLRAAGAEGGWTWTPSLDGGGGGRLGLLGGWRPYRRKLAEGGHLPLFSRELVPRNLFFPQLLPLFLTIFRLLLAPLFSRDSFLFLRPGHSVSASCTFHFSKRTSWSLKSLSMSTLDLISRGTLALTASLTLMIRETSGVSSRSWRRTMYLCRIYRGSGSGCFLFPRLATNLSTHPSVMVLPKQPSMRH
eukprot:jgi/Mesvir1/12559/Mv20424-RA.1